jgi:hypothetical protein
MIIHDNLNIAKVKKAIYGRTCHNCKSKIVPGERFVESGYLQCYNNICKKCISKFNLSLNGGKYENK